MYQISRTHMLGYLVEDGITSSVHARHTFSRTSIMLRFSYDMYRTHVPRTRYRYQVFIASSSSQQVLVPRSYCCTRRVSPLESSHGHHLLMRAASARAARGRCFDPKRAATAPGCRACSASPEHRVGSLLIGQDQTCLLYTSPSPRD